MTAVSQNVGTTASNPVFPDTTVRLSVTVTDANDAAVDLTGVQSIAYGLYGVAPAKDFEAPPVITKTLGSGVTVTDAVNGVFQIAIARTDTASLWPGDYYHQTEVLDAAGDQYLAMTGTFRLSARA